MDKKEKFSERLSELMLYHDIKSDELGLILKVSGQTIRAWGNGTQYITLSKFIKLADYFNCSLEFLAGRTETQLDYSPRVCPPFYERFREVIKEKGKTRYRMAKESKIKDSYFTEWKKGADPHILSVIEAADYLDVSIDYLVGRDG